MVFISDTTGSRQFFIFEIWIWSSYCKQKEIASHSASISAGAKLWEFWDPSAKDGVHFFSLFQTQQNGKSYFKVCLHSKKITMYVQDKLWNAHTHTHTLPSLTVSRRGRKTVNTEVNGMYLYMQFVATYSVSLFSTNRSHSCNSSFLRLGGHY